MNTYLITYDLMKPGQDYDDLHEAIKKLGTWWHCLDSTWIVKHAGPAMTIRDALRQHTDANDKLLVVLLSGEGAWANFDATCSKWLKDNL